MSDHLPYFVSKAHMYAFALLRSHSNPDKCDLLGIRRIHYVDVSKARERFQEIILVLETLETPHLRDNSICAVKKFFRQITTFTY